MSGWKDWAIGEVVTEADFQSFVQDQVVQRYSNATARNATLGANVAIGMAAYLEDEQLFQVYDGNAWVEISGSGGTTISDTEPSDPSAGDLWWDSDTGVLYIYYDSFWIEAVAGIVGAQGPAGGFDTAQTVENKSSNYSIVSGDAGKLITNSSAITITVDDVLSVGEQIDFLQNASGQITFTAGSGVTLNSKDSNLKTSAQYSPATIKCLSSGVYVLVGDLGA